MKEGLSLECSVGSGRRPSGKNRQGRRLVSRLAFLLACLGCGSSADAQIPILDIINAAVKKVIVATDLEVERLQTDAIDEQNTQKALENDMASSELSGITSWVQQQRDLFAGFYQELWQVKEALATFERVRDLISKQAAIVSGYRQASAVLHADGHFSAGEVAAMDKVLAGIVAQSEQNINGLSLVIQALLTQMGDAGRLQVIDNTGRDIDRNYQDLAEFSHGCFMMSMERAKTTQDVAMTKAMYGM